MSFKKQAWQQGIVILVAQGFNQQDIDYTEIFAPIYRLEAIKLLLLLTMISHHIKWM